MEQEPRRQAFLWEWSDEEIMTRLFLLLRHHPSDALLKAVITLALQGAPGADTQAVCAAILLTEALEQTGEEHAT